jgi:uncharacterized protein with HEPN domain
MIVGSVGIGSARDHIRRAFAGSCNMLIHGYDAIDHLAIWRVIQSDLAPLRAKVHALLTELGDAP